MIALPPAHKTRTARHCVPDHLRQDSVAMAYDEDLADRIREALAGEASHTEKRMFGGLAFMISGHMTVAASGDGLMARVDPNDTDELVAAQGVEPMVMGGRELRGWLQVADDALGTDEQLRSWVARCVAYVRSLPPK